ncbi:hypothetical protein K488DRAFT_79392 [Vararia minispora EC-137]|uniref:Uncharacterized protein n=1 Tax=Vararia minispora EC-137 TaxID=1314806 RepID=A0ACB8QGV3_9AGAM|nr:hypothetical protein K488DRAFT_79392 [Vararia minispora EC-137]
MAPTRTKDASSSSPSQHLKRKRKQLAAPVEAAAPGVSKLKAALRQTRRLLARENLAADVRVETERRLRALEGDLQVAEAANKERAMAERYHKHRFFDRQKLVRRIKRVKRQLAEEGLAKKDRKRLEKELFTLRVDVNYIIHWPKTERYVSLFPPEVRQNAAGEAPMPVPPPADGVPVSETDRRREEVRGWVRERMASGEIAAEPEIEQATRPGAETANRPKDDEKHARAKKRDKMLAGGPAKAGLAGDDFFGDD